MHQCADGGGDLDRRWRPRLKQDPYAIRLDLAEGGGLADAVPQGLQRRAGGVDQAVVTSVGLAHQVDPRGGDVAAGAVLHDIAGGDQGPQGAEQPGLGLAEPLRGLGHADRRARLDQMLQHPKGQQHGIDLVVAVSGRRLRVDAHPTPSSPGCSPSRRRLSVPWAPGAEHVKGAHARLTAPCTARQRSYRRNECCAIRNDPWEEMDRDGPRPSSIEPTGEPPGGVT